MLPRHLSTQPVLFVDPTGKKHEVSKITVFDYVKKSGYGPTGKGYKLIPVEVTVEKHEFTNLNVSVYKSGERYDIFTGDPTTVFHIDAIAVNNGRFSDAYCEDGVIYMSIEGLTALDEKYGTYKKWSWFKTILSVTSDVIIVFNTAKLVDAGIDGAKIASEILVPSAPGSISDVPSTINTIISEGEAMISEKSLGEKKWNVIRGLLPFIGTKENYDNVTDKSPKVTFERRN